MKEKTIVTSGKKYLDIDAYASIFAYRDFLKKRGKNAYAVSSAKENESVSQSILDLGFTFDDIIVDETSKFVILDVSNPEFFDPIVNRQNILEIIDHHEGFEDYWTSLGISHHIDFIGSVCTIIFERYKEHKLERLLDEKMCKLLAAGILDNTLNLKSAITSDRDKKAYAALQKIGGFEDDWADTYFASCYTDLENNLIEWIKKSTKIENYSDTLPPVFSQIITPNIDIINEHVDTIKSSFSSYDEWILNILSLKDGKSYILCSSDKVKKQLLKLFSDSLSTSHYVVLYPCMLRKEIMKAAREIN